jgi:hypothetical protein
MDPRIKSEDDKNKTNRRALLSPRLFLSSKLVDAPATPGHDAYEKVGR